MAEASAPAFPKWAADYGLKLCGQYFEGFVDDYEDVLIRHKYSYN